MAKSKPKPTVDEALFLIQMRRKRAREAINAILHGMKPPTIIPPSSEQILDYLTNMLMCIEMMLKLLSDDWRSHDVGKMFEMVNGTPHPNAALMESIKDAIMNQKYLLSPAAGLIDHVPHLEALHDYLFTQLCERYKDYYVRVEFELPENFGQFLLKHIERFYESENRKVPPGMSVPASMHAFLASHRAEVEAIRGSLGAFLAKGEKLKMDHFTGRMLR